MPFDYRAVEVTPGRTVPVLMDNLPRDRWTEKDSETGEETEMIGDYPVAHVEQLGPDNPAWVAAQIDKADPRKAPPKKDAPRAVKKVTVAKFTEDTAKQREERRAEIRLAVRHIDCRHKDGTPAVDADIPDWITALPQHAVDRLYAVAWNQANFYDGNFADLKEIAEK